MTYLPKMQATGDGMSVSFDVTPMVHDLARRVMMRVEEGAAREVVAFLAENGHLAEVIRKAKDEAWHEGFNAGWAEAKDPDAFVNDVWDAKTPNPYTEGS